MPDRRAQIAEAGVRVVASQGVRALTHRAIDAELGLAAGSTSYYARTRRDLLTLIVNRVAERTEGELIASRLPAEITPVVIADLLAAELERIGKRPDDYRARLLLWLELEADPDLRDVLATGPEARRAFRLTAASVLELLDVAKPEAHAGELVALLDTLALQRVVRTTDLDARAVLTAYLTGLPRVQADAPRQAPNPATAARGLLSRIRGGRP